MSESWSQLQALFKQVLELPPGQRDRFIDDQCGSDAVQRSELRELLAAHTRADRFLTQPAWTPPSNGSGSTAPLADVPGLVGRRIGQYRLERVIATGGMGTVYQASQEHPHRTVALKVMRGGLSSPDSLTRFQFEVEVLGRLQHPAIAQIFEAGTYESDGVIQPFFAMELIDGLPLTQYCLQRGLTVRQRLELFVRVCEGVEHAHQRGVIHRDLKPANILVAAEPKILDFGIARASGAQVQVATQRTQAGQLIGTVAYMSPEQMFADRDAAALDIRCDVYALGVILYELLSGGRLPHGDLTSKSVPEAVRIVREDEPRPLGAIDRAFRGDLEWITMKAIEKDRSRRYGSAAELAADIRRHLEHEPVLAGPPSAMYRLRKLVKRRPAAASAVASLALSMIIGLAVVTAMYLEVRQQRDIARTERKNALDAEARANALLHQARTLSYGMLELAEVVMSNLNGAAVQRLEIAERGLDELNRLSTNSDDAMRYQRGYGHQRVGEALAVLGRSTEALASHQAAFDLRQEHCRLNPHDENAHRALAVGHWRMADGLILHGRWQEVVEHERASLAIHEASAARWQQDAVHLGVYQGIARRRLGDIELLMGQPDSAVANFERSLELCDGGVRVEANNRELLRCRALSLRARAEGLLALGRPEEAIEDARASIQTISLLTQKAGPSNVWERANEARATIVVSRIETSLGRHASALETIHRAMAIAEDLSGGDPANFESRHLLGRCHAALAAALLASGDPTGASKAGWSATATLEAVMQQDANDARVKRDFAMACRTMGQATQAAASQILDPPAARAARFAAARDWYTRARDVMTQLKSGGTLPPVDEPILEAFAADIASCEAP